MSFDALEEDVRENFDRVDQAPLRSLVSKVLMSVVVLRAASYHIYKHMRCTFRNCVLFSVADDDERTAISGTAGRWM